MKRVVFDKTGTLTKGIFKVAKVVAKNGYSEAEVLRIGVHVEKLSNHPVAKSIVDYYDSTRITSYNVCYTKLLRMQIHQALFHQQIVLLEKVARPYL